MPSYDTISLHPQDHLPSKLSLTVFDVVCIGSGWAGRVLAARIVKAGLTAVISKYTTCSVHWQDLSLDSMFIRTTSEDLAPWYFRHALGLVY